MTDWADEIANSISPSQDDNSYYRKIEIAKALRIAKAQGMQEAAKIAFLEGDFHMKSEYQAGYERGRNEAATAIRNRATEIEATPA